MTHEQADILLFYLQNIDGVFRADVYDRTADATIHYKGNRETIIEGLRRFRYEEVEVPNGLLETSGRAMNAEYQEKLVDKILFHYGRKFLLPYPISAAYTTIMSAKYIWKGIKTLMERRIEVPVLDATAIAASVLRQDFATAGSVMFLLGIGELLEDRESGKTMDVCKAQLKAVVDVLEEKDWENIVIAYEPVWAIGTGKVATPDQAEETHAAIRAYMASSVSPAVAENVRIIYGGSVNAKNCDNLISKEDIDGFLVGGASLKPEFIQIINC